MRMFEKAANGMLVEVEESVGEGRRHSATNIEARILWTAEEEAARDAEEAAAVARDVERDRVAAQSAARRASILTKLAESAGLSEEEIEELLK